MLRSLYRKLMQQSGNYFKQEPLIDGSPKRAVPFVLLFVGLKRFFSKKENKS